MSEIGQRRKDIMRVCPEEFEDVLKEFIDDIENETNAIRKLLDIESITDIGCIEEAFDAISELSGSLY